MYNSVHTRTHSTTREKIARIYFNLFNWEREKEAAAFIVNGVLLLHAIFLCPRKYRRRQRERRKRRTRRRQRHRHRRWRRLVFHSKKSISVPLFSCIIIFFFLLNFFVLFLLVDLLRCVLLALRLILYNFKYSFEFQYIGIYIQHNLAMAMTVVAICRHLPPFARLHHHHRHRYRHRRLRSSCAHVNEM